MMTNAIIRCWSEDRGARTPIAHTNVSWVRVETGSMQSVAGSYIALIRAKLIAGAMVKLEHLFKHQVPDLFCDFSEFVFHLMVGKPDNDKTLCSQKLIAHCVAPSFAPLLSMVWPIDLKDKAALVGIDTEVNPERTNVNVLQPIVTEVNLTAVVNGVCIEEGSKDMLLKGLGAGCAQSHKNTHFPLWVWGVKTMVACTKPEPSYPVLATADVGVVTAPSAFSIYNPSISFLHGFVNVCRMGTRISYI